MILRTLLTTAMLAVSPLYADDVKRLVILGDSLTEGYGVSRERAYPAILQKKIDQSGKKYQVINAGISGSTSASAVSRMTWQLKNKPSLILLALGANDGLRGSSTQALEDNLNKAVELAKKEKVKILLAGMIMPPNYGQEFEAKFKAAYRHVAEKNSIPLLPFILLQVAGKPELNLADGIHPNEKGHELVAETVYNFLKPHL